ncbi:MAG TPA: CocE/NonD family hydrolase [Luteibacter sp.]|nr:CocE/NonD family hydrolase [Luteibacter sp.]
MRRKLAVALISLLAMPVMAAPQKDGRYAALPSETPTDFKPATGAFDYEKRDVMIPMRDGVKLHTVILVPKGAKNAGILFTRTPYDATEMTSAIESGHLAVTVSHDDDASDVLIQDGYIRVVQDVRGKYGSEGDYVMNRPVHGPLNPTPVDDSTDAYDTIDWLVHHVPESNQRVAILGISYDGFEPLMAIIHPHPALKAAVPMNPMVDGWMGDDWFHHGAFRQQNLEYIYEQTASRKNHFKWWSNFADDYQFFLEGTSAGNIAKRYGMEQLGFWNKVVAHPAYDSFWSDQAVDKLLAREPVSVPTMIVASLWDQEDIYGAFAVYKAMKPHDEANRLYLVAGPWFHGQEVGDGSSLGAVRFGSDTSLYFRQHILRPFLAHYLKDAAGTPAPVNAFVTGENRWETAPVWPVSSGQTMTLVPEADRSLHLAKDAGQGDPGSVSYVSDPTHPVPYRPRPVGPMAGHGWQHWLTNDQREAASRPDVATFTSAVLSEPVRISGSPHVHLVASTTGTDADWVVKLIDVYPDQVASQPEMGGYQLGIAMDIFRGRYREGFTVAKPLTPDVSLPYDFSLPNANHVFLPGHRIMVQVQSSWFPLYDRNPQKFVPNILLAQPDDFVPATQRIVTGKDGTTIELPLGKGA